MQKERFTEATARDIVAPIFDALIYCHDLEIVHRDIKPENIVLVNENGLDVKLIDFGSACRINPLEEMTRLEGTVIFMAPELLKKENRGRQN